MVEETLYNYHVGGLELDVISTVLIHEEIAYGCSGLSFIL